MIYELSGNGPFQHDESADTLGDAPHVSRGRRPTLTRKMTVEEEHSGEYFR